MTNRMLRQREAWLTALSLFIALRSLRAVRPQPVEDIRDIETLLNEHYPTYAVALQTRNDMALALRLGMTFDEGRAYSPEEIRQWLDRSKAPDNVVALFDFGPMGAPGN